jgi:CBS domain-containing protein
MTTKLVRELMTVGVHTCPATQSAVEAARFILDHGLESLVVLDEEGHAAGVLGRDELVAACGRDDVSGLTVEDLMRPDIPQIPPDIPVCTAAQLMRDQGVRAFYLMHHAGGILWPAAVITYTHLLRYLTARSDDELADLGIAAARTPPVEAFVQKRDARRRQIGAPDGESQS